MSHCPSCGRYVGPYPACPYCGARLSGRISLRAVKIIAILLATVGLAALWFAATRAEVPLLEIGQASATTNLAYVRLQGHCTRAPSYDPESEYLSFWLVDETGEVRVSAYRAETRQIIIEGRVPAPGDLVEVAGTLRVREDFLSLTIDVPEQLHVTRAEPVNRAIGAIAAEDQYLRVRVRGQVRSLYEPYEGLTLITVRDGSGSIPIAVSEDLVALSGISPTLSIGQPVEVVAAVSLYRGTPQLVPASISNVVPLPDPVPIAAERRIGQLTTEDAGQLVIVRGTVTDVDPFSAGVKLTVDDTSGAIVALLWQDVYDRLCGGSELTAVRSEPVVVGSEPVVVGSEPAVVGPEPGVGAQIQVQGEVAQYRGQLEVIPELAEDVQVLVPAALSTSPTAIGALTSGDVGRRVTLTGTLGPPEPFSAGKKFTLDDGTGQITLLLWEDEYERAPDGLGAGAEAIVTGEVAEYRGELELIPLDASQITVLSPGLAAQPDEPAEMAVGDVTPADVGRTLTLSGTLGPPEPFSAGKKFTLDDGTGQITLLLWEDEYERAPDGLGSGAEVIVTGEVAEYQGELELIPLDALKIQVLSPGAAPQPDEPEGVTIGDVISADVGRSLTLAGTLGEMETFSKGIKFPLDDGTGTIVLLLWQEVYDGIPDAGLLAAGAQVEVVGRIDEYQGELEIVPEAEGVRVKR